MRKARGSNFRHVAIAIALLCASAPLVLDAYRHTRPEQAYEQLTGRTLPPGVHATGYAWAMNDNFLHVGHYWVLTGTTPQLEQFARDCELGESPEALSWIPDTQSLLGISWTTEDVVRGYEGSQPRNNWLWILGDGRTALYEFN